MISDFKDDTVYPAEYSAGGINAYYVSGCDVAGHRPSFCICANKIKAFARDGSLRDSDCEAPIRNKTCVAIKMREEELAAGRAIYFIHREKLIAFQGEQRVVKTAEATAKKGKQPMVYPQYVADALAAAAAKRPAPEEQLLGAMDGGYAAAINAAIAEQQVVEEEPAVEQPAAKPAEPALPATPIKAGMSLLELARLKLAAAR